VTSSISDCQHQSGAPADAPCCRVLIVGGHRLTRYGLLAALAGRADVRVVGEVDGVEAAAHTMRRSGVDVVLLDAVEPCADAQSDIRMLTERDGTPSVVVVTNRLCECAAEVFAEGAAGLVLKESGPDQVAQAVRSVAAGYTVMPTHLTWRFGRTRPARQADGLVGKLSAREREVLACLADGRSNAEIAEYLILSEGTVKSHIQRVLAKLNMRDRLQAVVYAYRVGFVPGATPGVPAMPQCSESGSC